METAVLCVTFLISRNYTVQDRSFNAHLSTSSDRRLSKRVAFARGRFFFPPESNCVAPFETGSAIFMQLVFSSLHETIANANV